ncbi:Na+/H+ antiporter NhaA [Amycolatopsis acidiphila]|uniref:Na(+)/H(+) antiporter NhaA n=1 Tax=Amycolatopsis acidiphila TaxID=715473 RepID=A0A557ZRV5_9PSEU|nr:Na+/H+ antiporter NhaA [Amycolatopsis acidiphila]TVT14721.1 Na+/H+ antiporter NhaA [Amycolatopsis acidiphila]UIJ56865.1 Na+/H+ antiporter NhaA [Amycolatopsis acidiphila]GHG54697.1 Na(+)/H(+) antiporter NhaA [Amycolatopsis acidiphila]
MGRGERFTPLPPRPGGSRIASVPLPYFSPGLLRFLARESGSAAVLLACTLAGLVWANVPGAGYEAFWTTETLFRAGSWEMALDLRHWLNDAAMAVFFLNIGLEISREVSVGSLRDRRTVIVPALGAVGGLVLPALLYLAFEHSGPAAAGWGVPMSTDTAFLIGILALFGPRCPDQLRLFLLTLAIVDDIGAITVMAVFYTDHVSVLALVIAAGLVVVLLLLRWTGVWQLAPYVLVGLALWVAVFSSGVHPTLAGVLVGLIVPTVQRDPHAHDRLRFYGRAVLEHADPFRARLATAAARATVPAGDRLQDAVHPLSAFVVVPLFGMANAGVRLDWEILRGSLTSGVTIGVFVALVLGNAVGISVITGVALRTGLGELPGRVRYGHLIGGAVLAGIGFTISLFLTDLAFTQESLRTDAKIGVLAGSLVAAVLGSVLLRYLGERLPLCSIDTAAGPPPLPSGPWRDPTLA